MGSDEWREERVAVRGTALAVRRRGEGCAFFWGHGVTSCSADEDRLGLRLWSELGAGWQVVRIDARGHGASQRETDPDTLRWPELAADWLALADAFGHQRLVAAGASMGAATAIHAAVAAPERVEALVLMIPPTAWKTRAAQCDRYIAGALLAERDGVDALVQAEAKSPPIPLFEGLLDPVEAARARFGHMDAESLPAILRGAAASDLPAPGIDAPLASSAG